MYSQDKVEEVLVDKNGKEIRNYSGISKEKYLKSPQEITEFFYKHINSFSKVDHLFSIEFFMKSPHYKAKELFEKKISLLGKLKKYEIVATENHEKENATGYLIQAEYVEGKTTERLIFMKREHNGYYEILEYNIKVLK